MISAEKAGVERSVTMASHRHPTGQLTLTVDGSLQVETSRETWTVPPGRAAWIPPQTEHAERLTAGTVLTHLRLEHPLADMLPASSRSLEVTPLLLELINRVATLGGVLPELPEQVRLAHVLVDEVCAARDVPLQLVAPTDPRALRAARLVEDNPAERCSVAELAARAGVNRRTLERLFVADVGMSVGEWRQRLRLHNALRLLAANRSIAEVARQSGYAAAPAFIAVFKRHFGVTPHQYRRR